MSDIPAKLSNPFLTWPAAAVRALEPTRLAVCALALAVSVALGEGFLMLFGRPAAVPWQNPVAELQRLRDTLAGSGSGTLLVRAVLLVVPLALVWSVAGVWIARAELLRRRRHQLPTARWVLRRAAEVCKALPMTLLFCGILLLPGLLCGAVQRIPVLGPLTVSLLLPLLTAFSLGVVVVLVGLASYVIMPASIVAEGRDVFDLVARGYSYLYQAPFRFAAWWGLSLAVAALPLVGVALFLRGRIEPDGAAGVWLFAAAAVVALSMFWTLQCHVYLRLRWIVDATDEDEIADPDRTEPESSAEPANEAEPEQAAEPEPESAEASATPVKPVRTAIGFAHTIEGGSAALGLTRLALLAVGMLWAVLMMAAGVMVARSAAGLGLPSLTVADLRRAIETLGSGGPATSLALGLGAVLFGTIGLARPLKAVARSAAVQTVFGTRLPSSTALSSARRLGWQGTGSVIVMTAGIETFLLTLVLLALGWQDGKFAPYLAVLGGLSVVLLLAGALGLGAVAVEGMAETGVPTGGLGAYAGNGPETLASALAALVGGACRFVVLAGLAWLTWRLLGDSLSWWGGDRARWMRWGLDGGLVPESEPGTYRLAAGLAGCWFLLLVGLVLAYPVSYLLGWGVSCYLRARQQTQDTSPGRLDLTADEQDAVRTTVAKNKQWKVDLKARVARRIKDPAGPPGEASLASSDGPGAGDGVSSRPTVNGEQPPV
jgi:hypothetical protein